MSSLKLLEPDLKSPIEERAIATGDRSAVLSDFILLLPNHA
jgi:hypothetical protein